MDTIFQYIKSTIKNILLLLLLFLLYIYFFIKNYHKINNFQTLFFFIFYDVYNFKVYF